MEKLIKSLKRFLFLSVFLILGVICSFIEVIYLSRLSFRGVLGISTEKLSNTLIGNGSDNSELAVNSVIASDDARPVIIRKYLEKYGSPLAPYSDLIYQLSKDYGFEYYWIVAIAQQESNLCKKTPDNSFNCWGYGIHKNGTLKFDNYESALRSYAKYLKTEYFDKGLNTPELMMGKYCPSSNGSWAKGVNQFINEMELGKF